MPFTVKGARALSTKVDMRVTAAEKEQLKEDAALAGLSVGELVRRRFFGRPIVASADIVMVKELRRLGGLLKLVHQQSSGAYSAETAAALAELRAAISAVAKRAVAGGDKP